MIDPSTNPCFCMTNGLYIAVRHDRTREGNTLFTVLLEFICISSMFVLCLGMRLGVETFVVDIIETLLLLCYVMLCYVMLCCYVMLLCMRCLLPI